MYIYGDIYIIINNNIIIVYIVYDILTIHSVRLGLAKKSSSVEKTKFPTTCEGSKTSPCRLKVSDLAGASCEQLRKAAVTVIYCTSDRQSGFVAVCCRSHELSEGAASVQLCAAHRQKHRRCEEAVHHPAGMLSEHEINQINRGVATKTACAPGSFPAENVSVPV